MTDALHLKLKDGGQRKFMWLAVDQAHLVLAAALEGSIGTSFVHAKSERTLPEAIATDAPEAEWPATVVANWTDPGIDLLELRSAVVLLAAGAWATGAQLIVGGGVDVRFLSLGIIASGIVGWRAMRKPRANLELVLSPNSLRVSERRGAHVRTHELPRNRAGWLTAGESGLDWRDRMLALFNDADQSIANFKARLASVKARSDSAEGDAWLGTHLPGADRGGQGRVSVTSLVSAWWPYPERRVSVRGNAAVRRRWEEPDLGGFSAWDRKQRRLYAGVFGAFMLFFLVIAIVSPMSLGEAIAYFPLVVGGLAFAVRHLLW